jgi:hypothetical protein
MKNLKIALCLTSVLCLLALSASAQNPHYLRANESISSSTACYSVELKEAGF